MVLVVLIFQACYSFGLVFMICELCQRMSNSFDQFAEVIIQYHWYKFPYRIQKMLLVLIVFAQQETVFECFGGLSCSREAFKQVSQMINQPTKTPPKSRKSYSNWNMIFCSQVVNSAFSYFMVIRQFFN